MEVPMLLIAPIVHVLFFGLAAAIWTGVIVTVISLVVKLTCLTNQSRESPPCFSAQRRATVREYLVRSPSRHSIVIQRIVTWSHEEPLDRIVLHASSEEHARYERFGFTATNEMSLTGDNA
jgi:hypothetical protein